jgi:hypothetical protein
MWNKLDVGIANMNCFTGSTRPPSVRGDALVPFPPRAVHLIITRIARRGEFDSQFERGGSVEKIDNKVSSYRPLCLQSRPSATMRPLICHVAAHAKQRKWCTSHVVRRCRVAVVDFGVAE